MGGKSSPPPPDYSGLERVAQQQLDFSKEQYAEMKPFVTRLATTMADAQQEQMRQARDYYDYQTGTFRPVERGLVQQAQEFDTEAYRQQLAARAAADAAKAFQGSQGVMMREATRRGVNPASGAFGAASNANALGLAAMQTGAANQARQQAEQLGWARKMDVVGLGRGLAGASSAAYAGATGAGQAAGGTMMSAGNQYMQGLQQGAGTLGTIASGQASIYNAAMQQQDPLAQIVGTGLGIYAGKVSDRRLKENIELVGKDERTGLNLYEFSYKKGSGKRYVGVMADEVEKLYPDAVFVMPDGFMAVNYTMLGIEMREVAHG
jgi:hypothetical protein